MAEKNDKYQSKATENTHYFYIYFHQINAKI